jgi:hypothetical protein
LERVVGLACSASNVGFAVVVVVAKVADESPEGWEPRAARIIEDGTGRHLGVVLEVSCRRVGCMVRKIDRRNDKEGHPSHSPARTSTILAFLHRCMVSVRG